MEHIGIFIYSLLLILTRVPKSAWSLSQLPQPLGQVGGNKRIANLPQWQSVWGMFAESMSVGSQTQYYLNKVAVFVYVNKCKNCSVVSLPSRSKYFSLHMLQDDHPCREKYLWSLKLDDSVAYSLGPNFIFFQRKPPWMQDKEKEAHKAVVFFSWWASSFVWAMWSK